MTPRKKKAKRGAQAGNKNAQRHGFYSKQFTPAENKSLDTQDKLDLSGEVTLLRVMLNRLQEQISFDEVTIEDDKGNQSRNDHYLNQLNTLSTMTLNIGSLVRSQYLIKGKSGDIQSSILTALEELRLEMGI